MIKLKILKKENINHNVIKITVENPGLEFPTSSFIYIYMNEICGRPYTPINVTNKEIEFAIKVYKNGKVSNYINSKEKGEYLNFSEVFFKEKFNYEMKKVLMIAGGTGITPMLQIINSAVDTEFCVVFCNVEKKDIFLENWLKKPNVKVYNVIEKGGGEFSGFLTKEILGNILELEGDFERVYVCGPPGFMTAVCGDKAVDKTQGPLLGILKDLKFTEEMVYKF